MTKEQQIEEMATQIKYMTGSYTSDAEDCASVLYEQMGYRKQSEVIDEFANELKETLDDYYSTEEDSLIDICGLINTVAKKMKGVKNEVD